MKQLLPHLMMEGAERGKPEVTSSEPLLAFLWVSRNTCGKHWLCSVLLKQLPAGLLNYGDLHIPQRFCISLKNGIVPSWECGLGASGMSFILLEYC